jgi:hypothetical protein
LPAVRVHFVTPVGVEFLEFAQLARLLGTQVAL